MTEIPIANPQVSEEAKQAVCDVLDSGMLADGEVVRDFEAEFAEYVGVDHAIATSSGTAALHAMLEADGIGEGDVVLTTPFSFIASANAVRHAGAEVAFADICPSTFNLDPDAVRSVLAERDDVTALMPVHLYGLPADMDAFRSIAREFDIRLFEDAAQAHGATFEGESVGSLGNAGAFSFYPTKNMTTGEGGMITTDDAALAQRARRLIDHGRSGGYEHAEVGYNYRMTNIQAAIGRKQLSKIPTWITRRQEFANEVTEALEDAQGIVSPTIPDGRTHAFHQYTVRTDDQATLADYLDTAGVGSEVYYPLTIPEQTPYADHNIPAIAKDVSQEVLSIPIHHNLSRKEIETITASLRRWSGD